LQEKNYPDVKFVTLNVDKDNIDPKAIYQKNDFQECTTTDTRIAMLRPVCKDQAIEEFKVSTRDIVKKFVMQTVPLYKLIFYELVRQCLLLWRRIFYR
jgi:hypothetical protein